MNSPETNVDLHIDRALAALRNAHPRAGLDRRILHALEERASSTHRSRTALRLLPPLPLAAWVVSGALALAVLAALLLPHRERRMKETRLAHPFANAKGWGQDANITNNPVPSATATPTALSSSPTSTSRHPERSAAEQTASPSSIAQRASVAASRYPEPLGSGLSAKKIEGALAPGVSVPVTSTPSEATLLADLHAPSHPAPPLPLTPQEKALLRMLRRGNAIELASLSELDPTVCSARDAADAADFHAFFNPPVPTQPGDTE